MTEDQDGFRDFVAANLVRLSRLAFLLTGDRYLAEDLVQATLLKVASRWEQVTAGGDPEPYVRRVLYTTHVSWWRRRRVRVVLGVPPPEHPHADEMAAVDTAVAVRQALAILAPRQRAAVILIFEDLTEAETARVLGCSVGTVKSQVREALARLRVAAPELAAWAGRRGGTDE